MIDPHLHRLADVLVRYSTRIRSGDVVSINADQIAFPLVLAVTEAVLKAGGHPIWNATSDAMNEMVLELGTEAQLSFVSPMDLHRVETADAFISVWAETNTKALGRIDSKRVGLQQSARKPVMSRFMRRMAAGELKWCGTLFPTNASAQDAEMSLRQYERFVFEAGLLHLPDPVAAWQAIHTSQERVREFLQGKKELKFQVSPHDGHDGTDLTVGVDGATWINCAGTENFPDGEVFAGPQDVNGHVNYTFPAVHNGREVQGVRLRFKDGRVVDASASKNESFLIDMLDLDEGARNLGEIAIGTNYAIESFSRNTLFDEKIGGTFHAAVGAGYPESGNNNESGLHWDMVCDLREHEGRPGGVITIDGDAFHTNGRFVDPSFPQPAAR